jgi:hypothetical protein
MIGFIRSTLRRPGAMFDMPNIHFAIQRRRLRPAQYTYDPLPMKDCVRLLKIQKPHGKDGRVSISLKSFQHSKVVNAYKALSYTWGAPYGSDQADHEDYAWQRGTSGQSSDLFVLCDGRSIVVGKNLLQAYPSFGRMRKTVGSGSMRYASIKRIKLRNLSRSV